MNATGPVLNDLTEQDAPLEWRAFTALRLTDADRRLLQVLIDGPQAGEAPPPSLPSYALRRALAPVSTEVAARLTVWAARADPAMAAALLAIAVALVPDHAAARVALAWQCFEAGAVAEAVRHAARAYQAVPEMAAAAYGFFLLETGDLNAAERVLRSALVIAPDHAPLHWYSGLLAQRQGDLPRAAAALRRACTLDPALPDAAFALAWVLHDLGDMPEAEVWSARALATGTTGDRRLQAAWFALRRRDYDVAEAQYRAAACLIALADPRSQLLYRHWSEALQALGRGEEARRLLTDALQAHPEAARLWYRLGCIAQEAGDWQAADNALAQAHQFEPTLADAFFRRAQGLHGRGMAEGVAWLLEQALFLAPETLGARALLAENLREQGKIEAAQAYAPALDVSEDEGDLAAWLRSGRPLRLPTPRRAQMPDVSVVLVVRNQGGATLRALHALAAQTGPSVETILVDAASTDGTPDLLARVQGATILCTGERLGWPQAANQGAARARGRHILFLAPDAQVPSGALALALVRIEGDARIGVVGGKRATCDDQGDDPDDPCVHEVASCSSAFLLVRRPLWAMLGGFDPAFATAVDGDRDFCQRVWRAGFRVVCAPRVRWGAEDGGD